MSTTDDLRDMSAHLRDHPEASLRDEFDTLLWLLIVAFSKSGDDLAEGGRNDTDVVRADDDGAGKGSEKLALTCENGRIKTAPGSAPTLTQGLTRSLDYTEEGLMPNPTRALPCRLFDGRESLYQQAAADAIFIETTREVSPWSWITQTCGNDMCIEPDHLRIKSPVHLEYPRRLCVYCGRPAFTRDHLLPRRWSGDARRHFVAIVPACGTCNSLLRDTLTWSITERRAICHERLRKHFRKVLRTIDHTPESLAEMGRTLRQHCTDAMERKAEVLRMLAWPEDPAYDQRALERSGIENAWVTGFLIESDEELAEYVRRAA